MQTMRKKFSPHLPDVLRRARKEGGNECRHSDSEVIQTNHLNIFLNCYLL